MNEAHLYSDKTTYVFKLLICWTSDAEVKDLAKYSTVPGMYLQKEILVDVENRTH